MNTRFEQKLDKILSENINHFDNSMFIIAEAIGEQEELQTLKSTNPDTEEKKDWVRQMWDKHRGKIVGTSLGVAGIAALILSGIPLASLIPVFGMGLVNRSFHQAVSTATAQPQTHPEFATAQSQTHPEFTAAAQSMKANDVFVGPQIKPGDAALYYMKTNDGFKGFSLEEVTERLSKLDTSQHDYAVRMLRHGDSRFTGWNTLYNNLKNSGMEDDDIYLPRSASLDKSLVELISLEPDVFESLGSDTLDPIESPDHNF